MDKLVPTYDLEEFKSSDLKVTITANKTARELGFDRNGIKHCNFYNEKRTIL